MGGTLFFRWLEPILGLLLVIFVLLDVFLTVLYARIETSIFSGRFARLIWRSFRGLAKASGRHSGHLLSFCGPVILVLLVMVWILLLTLGTALIIHPHLGTDIRASNGDTATDFVTAIYAAGSSVAIVGASEFTPQTAPFRMLYLFNSLIGVTLTSLTLTYLMQVYTALRQRNVLGLKVHLASAESGDAAELIARLGPKGEFSGGYTNLADMAVEMLQIKEAHHFYPVLFYFRFDVPYYSVSRFTLVALDTVTLIKCALDDQEYTWLQESIAVTQLTSASTILVTTLEENFLPGARRAEKEQPDQPTCQRWRRRYFAAVQRLQQAGIQTTADVESGVERYVALRKQWDYDIARLAPSMAYNLEEIDPSGSNVATTDQLRAVHVTR